MTSSSRKEMSFADLGRVRQEVARLKRQGVLSGEEARRLILAVQQKEERLSNRVESTARQGVRPLYAFLLEAGREGTPDRVQEILIRTLQAYYLTHHPDMVNELGRIAPEAPRIEEAPPSPAAVAPSPPTPAPARRHRRTTPPAEEGWSLARFLETLNIGWGLLAAGLLIVGCSLALVVTLWQSENPLIRYLTFLGVTLGLNALGQIARRKFNLALTGNTLLTVSLLLMPLNLITADFLGAQSGQILPPLFRVSILAGLSLVAWSSFRLFLSQGAGLSALVFTALIGMQLLVEPLSPALARGDLSLVWAGVGVFLAGQGAFLWFYRRHDRAGAEITSLLLTAGLLGFTHLLLPARVFVEILECHHIAWLMPAVMGHLFGGIWLARRLRHEARAGTHGLEIARGLDTIHHGLVPVILALALESPGSFLPAALVGLAVYVRVAWWYRSRLALGLATIVGAAAWYAGIVLILQDRTGETSWIPAALEILAAGLLPLVVVYASLGEFLRSLPPHGERTRAWAAPVLDWAARCLLAVAVGGMAADRATLAEGVVVLGIFGLVYALVFRRREYAYLAAAAPLALLLLDPSWLPGIPDPWFALCLSALGLAYMAGGYGLGRFETDRLRVLCPALFHVALATIPFILGWALHPEITPRSVASTAACAVLCALVVPVHRVRVWPAVAWGFTVLTAGLVFHVWMAPLNDLAGTPGLTAWVALVAAVAVLGGRVLMRRGGDLGRLFGEAGRAWGLGLLGVLALCYTAAPIDVLTALSAGLAAAVLLAHASHLRIAGGAVAAAAFVLAGAFFAYHCIDPIRSIDPRWLALDGSAPRWLPLAPLAASMLCLGAAAALAGPSGSWRRAVFLKPLGAASILAAALACALMLVDAPYPDPRRLWTLSLALLTLLPLYFRATRSPVFLVLCPGLAWLTMAGLVLETAPDAAQFTLLCVGSSVVVVLGHLVEKGLEAVSRRPGGRWLRPVSLAGLRTVNRILSFPVLVCLGLLLVLAYPGPDLPPLDGFSYPGLQLITLGLLAWIWAASLLKSRRLEAMELLALAGTVTVAWIARLFDHPEAWCWVPAGLSLWAAVWMSPGIWRRWFAGPDPEGFQTRASARAAVLGHAITFLALVLSLLHPDHPGSVVAGGVITALWFWLAARSPASTWLSGAVLLGTLTALAGLHHVHPVLARGRIDLDALFPFCLLCFVLSAVWYGLGRRDHRREKAGTRPWFPSKTFRTAGVVLSLVTLGLLVAFVGPALDVEPTEFRAEYLAGAILVLALTAGYLALAFWERQPVYVYLAEACLAGFFLYLRITHPWIYRYHVFRKFWPLILVAVSYVAILLETLLGRLRVDRVYLGPLRFTGLILPLGPLLGVWLRPEIDMTLITTLGAIAAFYAMVAFLNRAVAFAYLSTAVANLTLMAYAYKVGWNFKIHPQVFLWPVGLSLLAVAHVQRRTLTAGTVQALRIIGTCILHGSLATSIFTDVVHRNLEMILLACLSLAGIMAGIGLRVRAFLYTGFGFLVFDVVHMVFLAGREDTWVWWMSGITLGVLVLFAFAFFEKRKLEVEQWVRKLRTWE